MKLVILESPYAGDLILNVTYARECLRDSLNRHEAPIASHLLYTQPGVLDDRDPAERQQGIDAGLAWRDVATGSVVYVDLGVSRGMHYGMAAMREAHKPVEERRLPAQRLAHVREAAAALEQRAEQLMATEGLDRNAAEHLILFGPASP